MMPARFKWAGRGGVSFCCSSNPEIGILPAVEERQTLGRHPAASLESGQSCSQGLELFQQFGGAARRYEYVVTLRAVNTIDFMTAKFAHLPFEFLEEVSRCIINEVSGISPGGLRYLEQAAGYD
jgi:hypothetical protein